MCHLRLQTLPDVLASSSSCQQQVPLVAAARLAATLVMGSKKCIRTSHLLSNVLHTMGGFNEGRSTEPYEALSYLHVACALVPAVPGGSALDNMHSWQHAATLQHTCNTTTSMLNLISR